MLSMQAGVIGMVGYHADDIGHHETRSRDSMMTATARSSRLEFTYQSLVSGGSCGDVAGFSDAAGHRIQCASLLSP
jgi:hypothetical protein